MFKNVTSQKVAVFAWDGAAGAAKTGDAANITAQISKDGGACAATDDASPTELDATDAPGVYIFDMLQAETNADLIVITPSSSTTDIVFRPIIIYTQTVMRGTDGANTVEPDVAGTAPTAVEIQAEMEENGSSLLDTIRDIVSNGTYGNSALQTLLTTIAGYLDTEIAAIQTDLDNGTDGLGALKDLIDAVQGTSNNALTTGGFLALK